MALVCHFLLVVGNAVATRSSPSQVVSSELDSRSRKLALLIGNTAYKNAWLRNPVNDARDLRMRLLKLGFVAPPAIANASLAEMKDAIRNLVADINPGDTVLLYFAGHGVQISGENYLIPVDFTATNEEQVRNESYAATEIANSS
jgi:uncharacterized caspase-like protein